MKRFIAFLFIEKYDVAHGWDNVIRDETRETASWSTAKQALEAAEKKAIRSNGCQEIHVVDLRTGKLEGRYMTYGS